MQSTATRPGSSTRATRIRLTRSATGLNPAEKLLLRTLVDFMGNNPHCWPSLAKLSTEVGVSTRHVRRMLRVLESGGWIVTRPQFRQDQSQTSSVYHWSKAPDAHVPPPRTSTSALELNIRKIESKPHMPPLVECDLSDLSEAPEVVEVKADDVQTETPKAATRRATKSKRFIVIDPAKFLDIQEADRVYAATVAAKLLNTGSVDRLAFFACWCAIAAKFRAGTVRHPERMMRFLLDNRKAMSAYPSQAAETKARAAIRHLYQEKPYNPHC